jgi:acetyl-CoA carboxylase biotin carboxyl carrier protein
VSLRYDEIAEILKIIDSSSCDELIVETGDMKLVVRRNCAPVYAAPASERSVSAGPAPSAPQAAVRETFAAPAKVETTAGQIEIMAPMVGTFYRAPSPDAPPFVEVGTVVRPGQPLCLIEVMKLFTTINSEVAGHVAQIGAENGELVEYGRTLFVIEPI